MSSGFRGGISLWGIYSTREKAIEAIKLLEPYCDENESRFLDEHLVLEYDLDPDGDEGML